MTSSRHERAEFASATGGVEGEFRSQEDEGSPVKTICLNMIVKDEAPVIERCLFALKPHIDFWVIVDTGSTDGTQDLIRRYLADIPGELHERPWVDFGHNRTEAIRLARGKADYILIMDADNILRTPPDWRWPELSADGYELNLLSAGVQYRQRLLVSDRLPWHWVGVVHEYLTSSSPHQTEILQGPWVDRRHEGARSRDPQTFRKDAALLEQAMQSEPNNERYAFYLAQSWRDAREPLKAREAYRHRAAMGGWEEEVWYSLYEVARLTQQLGGSDAEIRNAYLEAYQYRRTRTEPLVALSRREADRGQWALSRMFAREAMGIPLPSDRLFLDPSIYRWQAIDAAAIAAYWCGDPVDSFSLCQRLLDEDRLPEDQRPRVETNRDYAAGVVAERTAFYPEALVSRLASADRLQPRGAGVTLTVTSCKRLDLFERTINSFLNCCNDIERIERFVCIDDNSSPEDRQRMQARYPFFEFILKGPEEKGHARSMNRLLETVRTPYWLHLEDDWHYIVATDYVSRAIGILEQEPTLAQVVFNRNYAELLEHRALVGGMVRRHPERAFRYVLHEHTPEGPERDAFFARHPVGSRSNTWWPHFSLQPSLMDVARIRSVGSFDEKGGSFEQEFARRFLRAGWRTAFFDNVVCFHIGRLISERGSGKKNAYELNETTQF